MSGSLVVVSGPSGSGKSSLCRVICESFDYAYLSVSTTTRAPRSGEAEGLDYFFVTREAFEAAIKEGEFLEWAEVHGNYYGTSRKRVEEALKAGKTILFDIDVQGQASVKALFPKECTSVFVTTPTLSILKERLQGRGTDSDAVIEQRLVNALDEMRHIDRYDYLIINDRFEESLDALKSVVVASRYKEGRVSLPDFISAWKGQF